MTGLRPSAVKNISCKTGKFAGYGFDFADDQCGTIDTRTCVASSDRPDRWVLRGYAPGLAPGFTRLLREGGVRGAKKTDTATFAPLTSSPPLARLMLRYGCSR